MESTIRIPEFVQYAKKCGYTSVALTDHNVMYSAAQFMHVCKDNGIHGIIGLEVDCIYHDEKVPFLLLCLDNKGYTDLMKLSSLISVQESTCSAEQLVKACMHCHLIVYGEGGWFDGELVKGDLASVKNKLEIMKQELPAFDVALSYMDASLWKMRNKDLKRLCQTLSIRTVALNKIYYLRREDAQSYRILRGIASQKTLHDTSLTQITGRYYLSQREMEMLYESDDLARTDEIASMCRADYNIPATTLVKYPLKEGVEAKEYLKQLCIVGLKKRLHDQYDERYMHRLQYELSVIIKMHYENYFLIVYDFICFARKKGIYIGPGRGSAAGSLVAYCLGITMIDPIRYDLLFERFLNPERVSMPDIDTDIPDDKRNEVIQYVYEKYGEDHIANIVTFGTLGAKQVIRDVGKVMNIYTRDIDMITRLIPSSPKITLQKAYDTVPRLKQLITSDEKYLQLFAMAKKLEGLPRHTSIHAAGIIMSEDNINDIVPTTQIEGEMKTSQYSMEYLQERGLIKMDFLGLRNLSIIDEIVKKIKERDPSFNIMNIPMNDAKTFSVFSSADTLGIFQFESEGMKKLLRSMKPQSINDIAIAMALYRPGPMDNIRHFLDNREHPEKITYPSNALKEILSETSGIMIYQEQIMRIAQITAGFSLGKADILRKAISKKKIREMDALRQDFLKGALEMGYSAETAESLFRDIEKFAGYGFNKSHAVAYSYIAYQMAYLKANYPLDFYCSLLNSLLNDPNKTSQFVRECKRRRIEIYYPSVNDSFSCYVPHQKGLLIPLSYIKGVGSKASDILIKEREKNGAYTDFFDFVARANMHDIKRKQIESIIDAGGCDCFNETRMTYKYVLDQALSYADVVQIHTGDEIRLDLGLVSKPGIIKRAENIEYKEECERDALGFTLGTSRIEEMRQANGIRLPSIASLLGVKGYADGFAEIREVREHRTKKGAMMAFLKIQDETGECDLLVMPTQYAKYSSALMKGVYILFHAKIQEDGSFIAESMKFIRK